MSPNRLFTMSSNQNLEWVLFLRENWKWNFGGILACAITSIKAIISKYISFLDNVPRFFVILNTAQQKTSKLYMAWNEQFHFALTIISTITLLIYATIYASLNLQNKFQFLHMELCHIISVSNTCYSKILLCDR